MIIAMIEGWHRVCGKAQGYLGLPVRDMVTHDGYPVMVTAWTPTPAEIEAINNGANINVIQVGVSPQPLRVEIGIPDGYTDKPQRT